MDFLVQKGRSRDFHLEKYQKEEFEIKKDKPVGHELETCYYFNEEFHILVSREFGTRLISI